MNTLINTKHRNDAECIAETSVFISSTDCAALKKIIFKAARKIGKSSHYNIFEDGILRLFAMSTYDANSGYTDDVITKNLLSLTADKNLNLFNMSMDHIVSANFKNRDKMLYSNVTDIEATFTWHYQPSIETSIENLGEISIEDLDISVSPAYIQELQLDYLKTHTGTKYLHDHDTIIDGAVLNTIWTSKDNSESENIQIIFDKKNIIDDRLYNALMGKSIGYSVDHHVDENEVSMDVTIKVSKIQVFQLPQEITDECAMAAHFKSSKDFVDQLNINIKNSMTSLNYEYKVGQLAKHLLSMQSDNVNIPTRYSEYMVDSYMKRLCSMFKIQKSDLNDDYGKVAFSNTFKKCFADVSHLKNFNDVIAYIHSIAIQAVAGRLRMFSILEKTGISKLYVQILAMQNKLSIDKMLLHLFFEHLNKNCTTIFHKKEIIASYDEVEVLKRHANNSFWFDDRSRGI